MDRNAFMHIPYCSTGVPQEQFVTQSCVRETVNKNWSMKEKIAIPLMKEIKAEKIMG